MTKLQKAMYEMNRAIDRISRPKRRKNIEKLQKLRDFYKTEFEAMKKEGRSPAESDVQLLQAIRWAIDVTQAANDIGRYRATLPPWEEDYTVPGV